MSLQGPTRPHRRLAAAPPPPPPVRSAAARLPSTMPPTDRGLDTSGASALLQQRFSLEVERYNEGGTGEQAVAQPAAAAAVAASQLRSWTVHPATICRCSIRQLHPTDIQHTEARLRSALKELEIVRDEEARVLAQRTAALKREHEAAMQALERRFLADAEALQVMG